MSELVLELSPHHAVSLPLPALDLTDGTVVVRLCADRVGTEIHQSLTWHAQVRGGEWSEQPMLRPSAQAHLAGYRRVWVLVSYAGRRVGECRVLLAR